MGGRCSNPPPGLLLILLARHLGLPPHKVERLPAHVALDYLRFVSAWRWRLADDLKRARARAVREQRDPDVAEQKALLLAIAEALIL